MAEMLLINPRARRKARRAAPARKRRSTRARRRNPIRVGTPMPMTTTGSRSRYRRNPAKASVNPRRRRRNPISMGGSSQYMAMIKDGLMGGAGAVAVDIAYGQISKFLPQSLQRTPGQLGAGDAVKMLLTAVLGKMLSRSTGGMSAKAARGALAVQSAEIIKTFVPDSLTMGGLGYSVPARMSQMQQRIGPNTAQMARYAAPGSTPLLSRYTQPGVTALLSGRSDTMSREGYATRR